MATQESVDRLTVAFEKLVATVGDQSRRTDRSIFLLLSSAVADGESRELWSLWKSLPDDVIGSTDAEITETRDRVHFYIRGAAAIFHTTQWRIEFESRMKTAERLSDSALEKTNFPKEINPIRYRDCTIALKKRDSIRELLENAISESDGNRAELLRILRGQRAGYSHE